MSQLTLFVIIDPTMEVQPPLIRAADLANIAGGHIHAFYAVYEDDLSSYTSRRDAKYQVRHRAIDEVERLGKITTPGFNSSRSSRSIAQAISRMLMVIRVELFRLLP